MIRRGNRGKIGKLRALAWRWAWAETLKDEWRWRRWRKVSENGR